MRACIAAVLVLLAALAAATHIPSHNSMLEAAQRHSSLRGHHHASDTEREASRDLHWALSFADGTLHPRSTECRDALNGLAERVRAATQAAFEYVGASTHHAEEHCGESALFRTGRDADSARIAAHLMHETRRGELAWFERQHSRKRHTRQASIAELAREPLWHAQWHLHDSTSDSVDYWTRTGLAPDHMGVMGAWRAFGVRGRNVTVGVVDDGLDHAHPEFAECYSAAQSYDFDGNDPDPAPYVRDAHGTEAAALISARANGVCGAGVAPLSMLAGLRLIAEPVSDAIEAHGLSYSDADISVYSNSWGPQDDGQRLDGPGPLTQRAMLRATQEGRGGRGSVYVWAAGNGKQNMDSCNYDGFANSRLVIPVCAVDFMGRETYYSEWCSALLVCAPSSGSRGPAYVQGIATAQPHGHYGLSDGDCTTDFGGTSAAAPLVAGVVALMLEARPDLAWRDVQHVLALSATKNDPAHGSWHRNAAGHLVSHCYGFGAVNASAAVELARAWRILPASEHRSVTISPPRASVPLPEERGSPGVRIEFVQDIDSSLRVEFVELYFDALHPQRGDIEVILYSPAGTQSVLAQPHMDAEPNFNMWRFGSRIPYGESAAGTWSLVVRDALPNGRHGTVEAAKLVVWGY